MYRVTRKIKMSILYKSRGTHQNKNGAPSPFSRKAALKFFRAGLFACFLASCTVPWYVPHNVLIRGWSSHSEWSNFLLSRPRPPANGYQAWKIKRLSMRGIILASPRSEGATGQTELKLFYGHVKGRRNATWTYSPP